MKPRRTDAKSPHPTSSGGKARTPVLGMLLVVLGGSISGLVSEAIGQTTEASDRSSAAETATFLLVPLGARGVGMGGAVAGASADVEGALWNPAALAGVERWAVHYHGANDFGTSTHAVGGVARWRSVRVGLSLLAVDLGSIEARDAANQPIGTIDVSNTLAVLSLAYPVSSDFEAGVSYKLIRQGGSCSGCTGLEPDATGHAFDAAVAGRVPRLPRLRLGLIVSNLGSGIALRSGGPSDPLPTRIRLGGELTILPGAADRDLALATRADVQQTLTEFDDFDVFGGAELGYRSVAFLRAGYAASGAGRSGLALGLGIRYRGFGLDLGRSFDDFAGFDDDSPFLVSVSYQP